jgi:hypothetical protein
MSGVVRKNLVCDGMVVSPRNAMASASTAFGATWRAALRVAAVRYQRFVSAPFRLNFA